MSSSRSWCPYAGSFAHEAGSLPAGAEDSGDAADAGAVASPEETLLRYHLVDSESHQNTSSDRVRATVVNSCDSARTKAPLDAAGAVPEESFYPSERPRKRNRHEFEAGAPANPCPGADSHSTTSMEAFESELASVIRKHMGTSDVELNCIVRGFRLGYGSAEHRIQMKFRC